MAVDANTAAAFSTFATQLKSYGLGELFHIDAAGNPGGWLWNQIQGGTDTPVELMAKLEQTDVFRNRFGIIVEQQQRAAKGENVHVMSVGEVLEYENRATKAMVKAGIPAWFYDQPQDFHKLMAQNIDVGDLEDRLDAAYTYVQSAPPEVREWFNQQYGLQGDGALAAWALDPERTVADIQKATRDAYAGGIAKRFDIQINQATASRIGELGLSDAEVRSRFETVAMQSNLFNETLGEATDITSDDAVSAIFDADASAQARLNQRMGERQSINRATTGGAAISQTGVVGAGSS